MLHWTGKKGDWLGRLAFQEGGLGWNIPGGGGYNYTGINTSGPNSKRYDFMPSSPKIRKHLAPNEMIFIPNQKICSFARISS